MNGASMVEFVEKDGGFGLMKALSKVRSPLKKVSQIVENVELKPQRSEAASSRQILPNDVEKAQKNLKSRGVNPHDGLELWPLPGLAPMTRVRTSFGDVHSIALRRGDKVLLRGGEYKAIQWINRIMLDEHILSLKPDCNPVLLAAGSLGPNTPSTEMMVSPRQIFCADDRSGLAKPREASMLVSRPGIRRYRETGLTYTVFHVGESADIYCEGVFLRFSLDI